ncbi:MAG: TIGR03790 family protein [Limisphaerales bacterium]
MKTIRFQLVLFVLAFAPLLAWAGGDEVVVIYNSHMPESRIVAEHYAQVRQIPSGQVYGLALSTNEEISRVEFRDTLQEPLAKKLEADGLWKFGPVTLHATNGIPESIVTEIVKSKIRYAVLCYGVPLKISSDPSIHEALSEKIQPELRRNEASVDSELAWLPLSRMNFPLTGMFPNWLYGTTNIASLNTTNGILLVARLDGPSAEIANALVDKAVQAERTGLWGRAYFDARGLSRADTNYFLGDQWMLAAAQIARQIGFETTVDNNPATFLASFPMSHIAIYCGWYDGSVSGPFTLPTVEFMPGAFAYHLHSYSASTVRSANQNWCGPLLAKGASCTMGCVYEPFLSATPNVAVFMQVFGSGYSFGEAAWAAQPALSWQTTVIGDPLYRPFTKSPQQLHADLYRTKNSLDEWAYLRFANLALVHGSRLAEVADLLDNLQATTNSAVLSEKLADIYAAQGKPSSAIRTYHYALKLKTSPEQRVRLRLALGEKLQAENLVDAAVENYQQLLVEAPDYPGKEFIVNTITALQQKIAGTNAPAKP